MLDDAARFNREWSDRAWLRDPRHLGVDQHRGRSRARHLRPLRDDRPAVAHPVGAAGDRL